jgi:alpha-L-rhamnosidase
MLGTYFLLQYLQDTGRNDLLWTIVTQTTYPGWGYMLDRGATTWWEQWNGGPSRIHACFNSLDGWFYQGLAGIRPDPTAPGFKKIIIKPAVVGNLTWVNAYYDSLHGRIVSQWKYQNGLLSMHVVIPANTSATIYVPARDAASVLESGVPATRSVGLIFLRMESGAAVFHAGSGVYDFTSSPDRASTAR